MNLPITGTGISVVLARTDAVRALEARFGWLRAELYALGGNVSSLEGHKQTLWYAREKAVRRLNAISEMRDLDRR